jgi:hypothetical protein
MSELVPNAECERVMVVWGSRDYFWVGELTILAVVLADFSLPTGNYRAEG